MLIIVNEYHNTCHIVPGQPLALTKEQVTVAKDKLCPIDYCCQCNGVFTTTVRVFTEDGEIYGAHFKPIFDDKHEIAGAELVS